MKTSQIIEKFKNKAQGFDQRVRLGESMLGSRFVQRGKGLEENCELLAEKYLSV